MSSGNSLEELHQFFEDDPDDYHLEHQAENRLKSLYSCLVNSSSRTMLQIGLTGFLTYVKASSRSTIINDLLLSKDYISEIITLAADHFSTAPLLSGTCLYECMLNYPKKFSPFLINKFRPLLPRIIYKKTAGPSEICCKCIAHLSVLGIPSSTKQAKSWKNEYDHYFKIASLIIDQLYSGINESLCSDITDIETALIAEIGDVVSLTDYPGIFSNCCQILTNLFYVQLDSSITVSCEKTFQLINKVISINQQQFNLLHRKQYAPIILSSCIQLCDTLITFNPSSFMFNIRSMFTSFISLLDLVRPQAEYLTLVIRIYQLLTNFFAIFNRQVRIDLDVLQKFLRWIVNDSTLRPKSKISVTHILKTDHNLSRAVLNCTQQLLNTYSDHLPKDQYNLLQNHFLQTIMLCQSSTNTINKPYDDELCRVNLYNILECFLLNERTDCSTIVAISKDLIDHASMTDPSIKVKMFARKLKLLWQQIHDSISSFYQPWSFLNIDKPRSIPPMIPHSTNDLRNVFAPSQAQLRPPSPMPVINNSPTIISEPVLTKPAVYQTPMETSTNVFLPPPIFTPMETLPKVQAMPIIVEHEQSAKRTKIVDTRPVEIHDDDDEDGAEQIFADEMEEDEVEEDDEDGMNEYEDEDEEVISEEEEEDAASEITDDDDDDEENFLHPNGLKSYSHHLNLSHSDLLENNNPSNESNLQTINENLHKKFRRSNHSYSLTNDGTHLNNNYLLNQFNGEYKINLNKPTIGNGQGLPTIKTNAKEEQEGNDDDDDDDIVLVSDDDSTEKKFNNVPSSEALTYVPDIPASYTETVTVKTMTTTTTLILNDGLYAKDLLEDIERSPSSNLETSSVDNSDTSLNLAVQETLESIRDAISLVSDDYAQTSIVEQK